MKDVSGRSAEEAEQKARRLGTTLPRRQDQWRCPTFQVEVVSGSKILVSLIMFGGGLGQEVSSQITKVRAAFAQLPHLWRCHDIRLSLRGRVYNAIIRVLLYSREIWPVRVEESRQLSD